MSSLAAFASEVGVRGPVTIVGGETHWDVGGRVDPGCRRVRAPQGEVDHQPAEMIVRVGAGTTVAELDAVLARGEQMVPLDPPDPERATVGGVLSVGRSGPRRLRWGPLRDLLLEARFVTARGELAKAGGAVVKNVTGYDLCRLLVGSLGTLAFIGEVVLRTYPRPPAARWLRADAPPSEITELSYRPSSVLWDGRSTWVLLEGHTSDVDAETRALGGAFTATEAPPPLPVTGRIGVRPRELAELCSGLEPGSFVAEVGVGVVHVGEASLGDGHPTGRALSPAGRLDQRVKASFDPEGRLNPGRRVP